MYVPEACMPNCPGGSAPSAASVLSAFCKRPCLDLRLRLGHREMPKWRQIRFRVVEPTPRSFAASLRCFEKCIWSISSVMPHGGATSPALAPAAGATTPGATASRSGILPLKGSRWLMSEGMGWTFTADEPRASTPGPPPAIVNVDPFCRCVQKASTLACCCSAVVRFPGR